ncbi:uncharacterized protein L203_100542 [Cryptococcus depauperatus CBS 7841]|uniref:Extracellular membrane protein CFEM domain-containing protein n=1 Tax=Cryptococcus depauperatus CBS 7841 TaxID=1295531 RepID=A0AAJ8LZ36_9TREE
MMLCRLLILLGLTFPCVLASAAAQYHLKPDKDASVCFMKCHMQVIQTVQIEGTDTNSAQWITKNCQLDQWRTLMEACLPMACISAPDVAYAVEYGQSFCHRAGVKSMVLKLPESYILGPNGAYFRSKEYLGSGIGRSVPSVAVTGLVVVIGMAVIGGY